MKFDPDRLLKIAENIERIGKTHEAGADLAMVNRETSEESRLRKRATGAAESAWHIREAHKLLATKAKRAGFVPPTLHAVLAYAKEHHPTWPFADVESWWSHFQSCGWKIGKGKPMVDWQAAARNGFKNWLKDNPQAAPRPVGGPNWTPEKEAAWRKYLSAEGRPYKTFTAEMGWVRDGFNATRR